MHSHRLFRLATSTLVVAALALLITPAASAQSSGRADKLDPVLRHRSRQLSGRSRVIVQFKGDTDVRVFSSRALMGRRLGSRTQVAEIDNLDLDAVASDPRVDRVMFDRPAFATLERTRLSTGTTVARQQFGYTGKGVGVAVIDSGITNWHDDLYKSWTWPYSSWRVAHFKDFTHDLGTQLWYSNPAYDDFGHGTHVAGIIAGNGYDSYGKQKGLAPDARLVGLKVLDQLGHGYVSDVIAAIDYAVSIKNTYNVRVINLSVASGVYESYWLDPLTLAAKRAVDAGIVVVAAAGNLGQNQFGAVQSGGITSPGNAPWVLTVGAASEQGTSSRGDDVVSKFSSRGPTWIDFAAKPDIVAPGVGIESLSDPNSTLYQSLPSLRVSGSLYLWYKPYLSLSGTSMAAPVVAGTVALMLEANPSLTPNAVKGILQYTAQVRTGENSLTEGAGLLNTAGAIRLARFFGSPVGNVGQMSDVIEGGTVQWGRQIIWGNYRVTGGVPLPGSNAWTLGLRWGALDMPNGTPVAWGARTDDNIIWSTSIGADDNIIWSTARLDGDNIIWSTARAGDDNIIWSTATVDNVVWGTDCGGLNCQKVVWGSSSPDGTIWGTALDNDNIIWSTAISSDNIIWSTAGPENDNIIWSTTSADNIIWSTGGGDNIIWSTGGGDNIIWSTTAISQQVLWTTPQSGGGNGAP